MEHRITFTYRASDMRNVRRAAMRKWCLSFIAYYISIPGVALLISLQGVLSIPERGRGFVMGFLLGAVLMATIIMISMYGYYQRRYEAEWRKFLDQPVEVILDEEGGLVTVTEQNVRFYWSECKKISRLGTFCQLTFGDGAAVIIPLASLSSDQLDFIRRRTGRRI
jgi:hypothetical protein